jgi:DNA polymerase-3 subunit beta
MEVLLNARHLKAALCCAASQDVRYYLNGVLAEVMEDEIRLASTDGHVALVCRTMNLVDKNPAMGEVIVPIDAIKRALVGKAAEVLLRVVEGKWSLGPIAFTPVEGKFPDYRRIIPSGHSNEAAQFATSKIDQFAKVGRALGRRDNPIIRHNGEAAAQVQFYGEHDVVGVLMPIRAFTEKQPDTGLEQWGAER